GHDLSAFRYLFLAGERLDPPTLGWAQGLLGVPGIRDWGETESGWDPAGNPRPAGRLPRTQWACNPSPSSRAHQPCRCPDGTSAHSIPPGARLRPEPTERL